MGVDGTYVNLPDTKEIRKEFSIQSNQHRERVQALGSVLSKLCFALEKQGHIDLLDSINIIMVELKQKFERVRTLLENELSTLIKNNT